MSGMMQTLHEISVEYAKKQPGMIDALTEDAPILKMIKWTKATHGLWNVAEKLNDIKAPAFVHFDSPLPSIGVTSDLVTTDLQKMGGEMEVPTDRAMKFGGPMKYFARKQDYILKKAGMDTEVVIVMQNLMRGAMAEKNLYDAGGSGKGYFILACRFDPELNVGLYDPDQFAQGRLFNISFPYDGAEHYLRSKMYEGVLGYSVVYRSHFGYQMLDAKRTVAAIVNIDEEHHPTINQIDDMLAQVRAQPGNTHLFMGPRGKIYGINPYKHENVQLSNGDTDAKTRIETWNGISITTSYNIADKIEHITVK
ncbi:MAG: hypothetical protein IJU79_02330 [Desulfovibrionaceae bacterium]|nr:hypothetical protein [Desulfovibrionaceae bacterium]